MGHTRSKNEKTQIMPMSMRPRIEASVIPAIFRIRLKDIIAGDPPYTDRNHCTTAKKDKLCMRQNRQAFGKK
jgi:hypothetical protein